MNHLATLAMDAHGGLDRWRKLKSVSARLLQRGVLWKLKGQDGILRDVHITVDLRNEWASHWPFGHGLRRASPCHDHGRRNHRSFYNSRRQPCPGNRAAASLGRYCVVDERRSDSPLSEAP